MKVLLVIDAQNDFIDGPLGTKEAKHIVPYLKEKITTACDRQDIVIFTQDTHFDETYLLSEEGKKLPIKHCLVNTTGWDIHPELDNAFIPHFKKPTFGSITLWDQIIKYISFIYPNALSDEILVKMIDEIEICGFCTDICVIYNALILKTFCANYGIAVSVDANGCAGTSPKNHEAALKIMNICQINIKRGDE